ncbi:MAG: beta-galactosidase, partial [Alphaproteobacteria bacterium]
MSGFSVSARAGAAPSFLIADDAFLQDGEVVQLRSCSFHYSRAPSGLWADRLARLAAMGCNTIQTYVPWNFHEAEPGA